MAARKLADELEVSLRTIYRDMDVLSSAGFPVYANHGPNGDSDCSKTTAPPSRA
ncbi:MAG: HTH domain-containing protein [Proteobacteria bacterium]|nr:HTH domain-containing protein [Pseudomonadota bacterium]